MAEGIGLLIRPWVKKQIAAAALNGVTVNYPKVVNGEWQVFDPAANTYVPTGATPGKDGASAYQIWLDAGNTGTQQDFLNSLKGDKGEDGTSVYLDENTGHLIVGGVDTGITEGAGSDDSFSIGDF
jgi:hypothetical protein